jgi:hypothetical protein
MTFPEKNNPHSMRTGGENIQNDNVLKKLTFAGGKDRGADVNEDES